MARLAVARSSAHIMGGRLRLATRSQRRWLSETHQALWRRARSGLRVRLLGLVLCPALRLPRTPRSRGTRASAGADPCLGRGRGSRDRRLSSPVCRALVPVQDWIWDSPPSIRPETWLGRWRSAFSRFLAGDFLIREPAADLEATIREAAGEYGIPALSLPDALRLGALQELGVDAASVS